MNCWASELGDCSNQQSREHYISEELWKNREITIRGFDWLRVRAELTERLVASLAEDVSPEITTAQLAEVRRRIAQVESGEVTLIPGDEALARVRSLLAQHLPSQYGMAS